MLIVDLAKNANTEVPGISGPPILPASLSLAGTSCLHERSADSRCRSFNELIRTTPKGSWQSTSCAFEANGCFCTISPNGWSVRCCNGEIRDCQGREDDPNLEGVIMLSNGGQSVGREVLDNDPISTGCKGRG